MSALKRTYLIMQQKRTYFFEKPPPGKKPTTWEEIEKYAPRVPRPEDYEWPKGVPKPVETTRASFHEFMRGRPLPFSLDFLGNSARLALSSICLFVMYVAARALHQDDFTWIDEERKRIAAARKKLDRMKKHQEQERTLREIQMIESSKKN